MQGYRARQIAAISDAVAAARLEVRRRQCFEPLLFAEVFLARGGLRVPGGPDDEDRRRQLAEALLTALRAGRDSDPDPTLRRELHRVRQELAWARALEREGVVGFRLRLPAAALQNPICEHLLNENHGLGPGVYRKYDVVVLRPECDGYRFEPVLADEIES